MQFQIALASFGAYFLASLVFLFLMGSHENLVATHEMDNKFSSEFRRRTTTRSMSENDLMSFFVNVDDEVVRNNRPRSTSMKKSFKSLSNLRSRQLLEEIDEDS